jgi:hypothetical protein
MVLTELLKPGLLPKLWATSPGFWAVAKKDSDKRKNINSFFIKNSFEFSVKVALFLSFYSEL